eukprot:m.13855 g.13855  ORF g.13855 m.13855 type:complete len:311 (-) comp6985_c0_seq1:562-1494(-)
MGDTECQAEIDGEYDRPMHVGAIFILAGVSLFGTCIPLILSRIGFSSRESLILPCGKLLGGGVILGTAFIHMLGPSSEAFSRTECLPEVFSDYSGFSGLICLMAVLFIHGIQVAAKELTPKHKETEPLVPNNHGHGDIEDGHGHSHGGLFASEKQITTYILELGIAMHSVIIGVTLGVARGNFVELLIALSFHQFFEGLALSSVVQESEISSRIMRVGLIVFYSVTTPIGVAIGVALNESYNENSQSTLLVTGSLDAISAGVLLYDALVNLIQPHFASGVFHQSSRSGKLAQIFALWLGAGVMAFIGRYA